MSGHDGNLGRSLGGLAPHGDCPQLPRHQPPDLLNVLSEVETPLALCPLSLLLTGGRNLCATGLQGHTGSEDCPRRQEEAGQAGGCQNEK